MEYCLASRAVSAQPGKRGLPDELQPLKATLCRGLEATATLFAPLLLAFGWVHRAAHILGQVDLDGATVPKQLGRLLGGMRRQRETVGELREGDDHVVKVSCNYWPGLFACYETPTFLPAHPQKGQQEFQVRPTRRVRDHLHLVDHDRPDLFEEVGGGKRERGEFFVREQADVVMPAH